MPDIIRSLRIPVAAILALVAMTAASGMNRVSTVSAGMGGSVQIATANGNQILTDSNMLTLYIFSADTANSGTSACTGACATPWPPATVSGAPVAPSGLMGVLATITRDDGSSQLTYNGMPLYRFARDTSPGQTTGQGITAFGGTWTVATP